MSDPVTLAFILALAIAMTGTATYALLFELDNLPQNEAEH